MMNFQEMRAEISNLKEQFAQRSEHGFFTKVKALVDELNQAGVPITFVYQAGTITQKLELMGQEISFATLTVNRDTAPKGAQPNYEPTPIVYIDNDGKQYLRDDALEQIQNWALKIYARREYFNDIFSKPDDALTKQAITVTKGDERKIKGVSIGSKL
jgi:hypothetical protein